MNITIVGGAGTQALGILDDLSRFEPDARVTLLDVSPASLERRRALYPSMDVTVGVCDLGHLDQMTAQLAGADVVVMAGPTGLCLPATQAALAAGVHYVDLGTFPEETEAQLELDGAFRDLDLVGVLGVGSAPGITSVMARSCVDRLDTVRDIDVSIAMRDLTDRSGRIRWPFTADAILDEHTEPARAFLDGRSVDLPPRTARQETYPAPIGTVTLMATNHPEPTTFARSFARKGVQNVVFRIGLPDDVDHAVTMLHAMGLAARRDLTLRDGSVVDLRAVVLTALMSTDQCLAPHEEQWSATRVVVVGQRGGETLEISAEMIVAPHRDSNLPAGLRKTAIPPAIVAVMIARGEVADRGVLVPETCVDPAPFFRDLSRRGMNVRVTESTILGGVA